MASSHQRQSQSSRTQRERPGLRKGLNEDLSVAVVWSVASIDRFRKDREERILGIRGALVADKHELVLILSTSQRLFYILG
jgi:hypothetical protein